MRRIVLVTQEHHVFIGTVRDNLAIAAPDASDEDMLAALERAAALVGGGEEYRGAWLDGVDRVHRVRPAQAVVDLAHRLALVVDDQPLAVARGAEVLDVGGHRQLDVGRDAAQLGGAAIDAEELGDRHLQLAHVGAFGARLEEAKAARRQDEDRHGAETG